MKRAARPKGRCVGGGAPAQAPGCCNTPELPHFCFPVFIIPFLPWIARANRSSALSPAACSCGPAGRPPPGAAALFSSPHPAPPPRGHLGPSPRRSPESIRRWKAASRSSSSREKPSNICRSTRRMAGDASLHTAEQPPSSRASSRSMARRRPGPGRRIKYRASRCWGPCRTSCPISFRRSADGEKIKKPFSFLERMFDFPAVV
jgi:hypothetical protein